jgi:hypothetical protein
MRVSVLPKEYEIVEIEGTWWRHRLNLGSSFKLKMNLGSKMSLREEGCGK